MIKYIFQWSFSIDPYPEWMDIHKKERETYLF